MKKNLIITLFTLFTGLSSLYAQKIKSPLWYSTAKTFEYGVRTGFTTSILNSENDLLGDPEIRVSFMGGVFGRYSFTDRFFINVGADLSPRGGGFTDDNSDNNINLTFIDVPVVVGYNVRYNLFKLPFQFDLFAGLQPSFLIDAQQGSTDISDGLNPVGADLVIGSGFPLWRFMFYATNKIGLSNISDGGDFLRSITTEWTLGYRFGGKNSGLSDPDAGTQF